MTHQACKRVPLNVEEPQRIGDDRGVSILAQNAAAITGIKIRVQPEAEFTIDAGPVDCIRRSCDEALTFPYE